MRSLVIADRLLEHCPDLDVSFVISGNAQYFKDCRYSVEAVSRSPTKVYREFDTIVNRLNPDLVIFDNAGEVKHFRSAKKSGALVGYITPFRHKRSKAMSFGALRVIDKQWIAQPDLVVGKLSLWEQFKARVSGSHPVGINVVFSQPCPIATNDILGRLGLIAGEYLLFSAGSGGHKHDGTVYSIEVLAEAAKLYSARSKKKCVVVLGQNYTGKIKDIEGVVVIDSVRHLEFIGLLNASAGAVLSGGDSLLQAISLHVPTLAVAIAKDQHERVRICTNENLALCSEPEVGAVLNGINQLVIQEVQNELISHLKNFNLQNGLDTIVDDLVSMLESRSSAGA